MNSAVKITVGALCVVAVALGTASFPLFRGYLDRGLFEVKQTDWSSSGKVAILAERSDHQALRSNVYFVLIANRVLSATELQSAYYRPHVDVIFAAASDCPQIRWSDPHNLVVSCSDGSLDQGHINNVQQHQSGDVRIAYVNIPDINPRPK
jgi:hypothetical protein